jgi:hypothetical protein
MARFDPARYAPTVTALLREPRLMPLDRGEPNRAALDRLSGSDEGALFDGQPVRHREMARACLAGLWLYRDFLDEAHRISQALHSREGSYWHGIMHRREGDFANAKYWFRRAGPHPIHEALNLSARARHGPERRITARMGRLGSRRLRRPVRRRVRGGQRRQGAVPPDPGARVAAPVRLLLSPRGRSRLRRRILRLQAATARSHSSASGADWRRL